MRGRVSLFTFLLAMIAGGVWSPPALAVGKYLLFTAEMAGVRCEVYEMDGEGNLSLREVQLVGEDAYYIAISPDKRTVVLSAGGDPIFTSLHINDNGTIGAPCYLSPFYVENHVGLTFHSMLPIIYTAACPIFDSFAPRMDSLRFDQQSGVIEYTGQRIEIPLLNTIGLGYSPFSQSLFFLINIRTFQSIRLGEDGSFGPLNPPCHLPTAINSDVAYSPDGHWIAASTIADPNLQLYRINHDGTTTMTQGLSFPYAVLTNYLRLAFTSDSRRLLVVGEGECSANLFELDQERGELNQISWVSREAPGYHMYSPQSLAVTPDDRFVVFASPHHQYLGYDMIYVARIHENGTLEYLPGKEVTVDHHLNRMAFAPLPEKDNARGWAMYP